MPRVLHQVVAKADAEAAHAESLTADVRELKRRAECIYDRAEQQDDLRLALAAVGQLVRIAELHVEAVRTETLSERISKLEQKLGAASGLAWRRR